MKKLIFDVKYDDEKGVAKVAALEFENFTDKVETNYYTQDCKIYSDYIPGEFYKRELPDIMLLIHNKIGICKLRAEYDAIIVDGLYMLGKDHPGLGAKLKEMLNSYDVDIEVIGIAKSYYKDCEQVAGLVYRGKEATKPLYVNGSLQKDYVEIVKNMAGDYRLPYLVKQVDKLSRM